MYYSADVAKMVDAPDFAPLCNSPDDLYQQFINVQESHNHIKSKAPPMEQNDDENRAFDLTHEFESLLNAHLQVLINLRAKRSLTESDNLICKKLEVMLIQERNTWRLAKALLKDKLPDPSHGSTISDSMDVTNGATQQNRHCDEQVLEYTPPILSEEQMIGRFYLTNREVLTMQIVTDWLEANEADDMDYKNYEDKVEFYSEGPTAWENTFH